MVKTPAVRDRTAGVSYVRPDIRRDVRPFRCLLLVESVQSQLEGTVSACVVAKGCHGETGSACGVENVLVEVRFHALYQHITGLADTTADDNNFGIHGGTDVAQEQTHVGVNLVQNCQGCCVLGLGGIEDILAGQVFNGTQGSGSVVCSQVQLGQTDNTGGGAVLLDTTVIAAVTGNGLFRVHTQVTDIRAGTGGAMKQMAFHNDTAADTGTEGHKDHIVTVLAAALPEFAQSGNVGIVTCLYRETGEFGQLFSDVENTPAQDDTLIDHALGIDGTGNTDAQTQNDRGDDAVGFQIVFDRGCDVRQDLCAAACGDGGNLPLVQHGAGFIKLSNLDGGAAKVNAKAVFHGVCPPETVNII